MDSIIDPALWVCMTLVFMAVVVGLLVWLRPPELTRRDSQWYDPKQYRGWR